MKPTIRSATPHDVASISRIYGWSVENESASYEAEAPSEAVMTDRMRSVQDAGLPYLVAETANTRDARGEQNRIVGFAYASPFRSRAGYRYTVEDTIYVDPSAQRMGVGRALLQGLIAACNESGYRQMLAVIGGAKPGPSVALHQGSGFVEAGRLKSIGFKFGEWHDVIMMQLELAPGPPSARPSS